METIPAGSTIARSIQPCQQKDGDQAAIIYGESAEGHETVVKIKKRGIRNVYCDFDKGTTSILGTPLLDVLPESFAA